MSAILDSFHRCSQYYMHLYRGGGWISGATKWQVKSPVNGQMAFISATINSA